MQDTYDKLNEIFQDIFDDDSIRLKPEMTAQDIEGWDSLANINIIFSIEEEFGIKFEMGKISELRSIGEMVEYIEKGSNR